MVIGYFYWDPNRAMFDFNLPLLGRPLLWYGFLFAMGFFVAYWILVYLLHRYFLYHCEVASADIVHWPDLIQVLKHQERGKQLLSHCSAEVKQAVKEHEKRDLVTQGLQRGIVRGLNALLRDESWEGFSSSNRILRWYEEHVSLAAVLRLRRRFALEQTFRPFLRQLTLRARIVADKLTLYVIIGTLVGARLGDALLYQNWKLFYQDPLAIFRIWEGGLASHGGAVGILFALVFFDRSIRRSYPYFSLIKILDLVVIPTALATVFIRVGNFVNQEILGKPTDLPWAVVFGHPADGGAIVPRHPVQLYEALAYLALFIFLLLYWKRRPFLKKEGTISGLFLILTFTARFLLEFFKEEQSVYFTSPELLTMGQILSIPFIALGFWLFFHRRNKLFDLFRIKRS